MNNVSNKAGVRLTVLQLISYGAFAPMNYYSVLLVGIGLSSTQIGFWGSLSSAVAMLTLPLWGVLSDKIGSAKKLYLVSMIIYAAVFALLPFAGSLVPITLIPVYILIVFYSVVKQPTHSLQDAWFIDIAQRNGVNYTSSRKWGSLGFSIVSVFFGFITVYTGTGIVFYSTVAFVVPLLIICAKFPGEESVPAAKRVKTPKIKPWLLFKNYYLMTAFIMTVALSFYTALITPFYPFILESAGLSPNQFGTISGYGAFVQVICMWIITRYCYNVPLTALLIAGTVFGALENVMYGLASGFLMMLAAGTLWGFAMAIYVSILPLYIHSLVPRSHAATALSLNGTVVMLLTILGNYAGGRLIASIGIDSFNYLIALLKALLMLLFILSLFIGKKLLKLTPATAA